MNTRRRFIQLYGGDAGTEVLVFGRIAGEIVRGIDAPDAFAGKATVIDAVTLRCLRKMPSGMTVIIK